MASASRVLATVAVYGCTETAGRDTEPLSCHRHFNALKAHVHGFPPSIFFPTVFHTVVLSII